MKKILYMLILSSIFFNITSFASVGGSSPESFKYEDTLWLIQLMPENRATIYEGKSGGGLTQMLNIVAKYIAVMEPNVGAYPKAVGELHFFSEAGRKVLYIGDSWIGDGEKMTFMSSKDYQRMVASAYARDYDSKRALAWIEQRNAYYEKLKKKMLKKSRFSALLDASYDTTPEETINNKAAIEPIAENSTESAFNPSLTDAELTDNTFYPSPLIEDQTPINNVEEQHSDLNRLQIERQITKPISNLPMTVTDKKASSVFLLSILGYALVLLLVAIFLVICLGSGRK